MKDSMIINAPNLPKPTTTSDFALGMLILILIGVGILSVLLLPAGVVPVYMTVICALTGGFLVLFPFYAIALRIKATKRRFILNKDGVFIQYDNYSQHINWHNISRLTLVMAVRSYETGPKEADPYFFFTLNSGVQLPPELSVSYRKKPLSFIAYPSQFSKFIGPTSTFSFGINTRNGSEVDPVPFFSDCGITLEIDPPIMEVQTITEYNQLVKEMYAEEGIKKYLLPEDIANPT